VLCCCAVYFQVELCIYFKQHILNFLFAMSYTDQFPVGKITEKSVCRSVFFDNIALYFQC